MKRHKDIKRSTQNSKALILMIYLSFHYHRIEKHFTQSAVEFGTTYNELKILKLPHSSR